MDSRASNQAWSKGLDAGCRYVLYIVAAEIQTAIVAYLQKENPIIQIFCISGWLAFLINP